MKKPRLLRDATDAGATLVTGSHIGHGCRYGATLIPLCQGEQRMSSEIRVVAVVQGKSGTADAIEQALLRCVAPSRAETGCLLYTPHRDLDRAERFVFFERWASRAALAEHERTEHFKELVRELAPLVAQPLDMTILEALLND
ncbi:putative quinol monooxygenase [Paraburkholderia sp. MM5477-R1]|uniref:putative quinol monooxygenase n=1 Tax=Paraburkholderia sp. MM5477-R1 TaxID=2991062 RepID=UPI003D1F74F8